MTRARALTRRSGSVPCHQRRRARPAISQYGLRYINPYPAVGAASGRPGLCSSSTARLPARPRRPPVFSTASTHSGFLEMIEHSGNSSTQLTSMVECRPGRSRRTTRRRAGRKVAPPERLGRGARELRAPSTRRLLIWIGFANFQRLNFSRNWRAPGQHHQWLWLEHDGHRRWFWCAPGSRSRWSIADHGGYVLVEASRDGVHRHEGRPGRGGRNTRLMDCVIDTRRLGRVPSALLGDLVLTCSARASPGEKHLVAPGCGGLAVPGEIRRCSPSTAASAKTAQFL